MKKKMIISLALALCLLCALSVTAFADSYTGGTGWAATFTADGKMVSTFKSSELADVMANMQPGDDAVFTVTLSNQNQQSVDWYMFNQVLKSMEDGTSASGGAYTYQLSYVGPSGVTRSLYDSEAVGGASVDPKAPVGLHGAGSATADYFYLDTMTKGQTGTVTLRVALDGESHSNVYQSKFADLKMKYAVEVGGRTFVRTGDDTNAAPYFIAAMGSGALLMLLGFESLRLRRKEAKERV